MNRESGSASGSGHPGSSAGEERHIALSLRAVLGVFGVVTIWIAAIVIALLMAPTGSGDDGRTAPRPHVRASSGLELSSGIPGHDERDDIDSPKPDANEVKAISIAALNHIEGLIFKYEKRIKGWGVGKQDMGASLNTTEARLDDIDSDLDRYRPFAENDPNLRRALGQIEEAVGFYRLAVSRYVIYSRIGSSAALADSRRYLRLAREHKKTGMADLMKAVPFKRGAAATVTADARLLKGIDRMRQPK